MKTPSLRTHGIAPFAERHLLAPEVFVHGFAFVLQLRDLTTEILPLGVDLFDVMLRELLRLVDALLARDFRLNRLHGSFYGKQGQNVFSVPCSDIRFFSQYT